MAAHRRSMRNTIRRSKERQHFRDLEDERYRASCPRPHGKELPGLKSMLATIADAWANMFSDCGDDSGGKVMVRNTMVPRGREVKAREWKQLDKRTGVRFYPLVQAKRVPTRHQLFADIEGGLGSLFFSNADTMNVISELSSGEAKTEWLELLSEIRSEAARGRKAFAMRD